MAFSQTNIIAARSHASSEVIDKNDHDNFGGPEILPTYSIVSVEYLRADCIVEMFYLDIYGEEAQFDTICEHPFLQPGQIDIERIKAMYAQNTRFIGFEKLNSDEGKLTPKTRKESRSKKSGALLLLVIGGGAFLMYLFVPKFKVKTS